MLTAYKYRLYPTEAQKALIAKTFGCCRYVYNKALALKIETFEKEGRNMNIYDIQTIMVKEWKVAKETAWLNEVNSQALQESLHHLKAAYTKFFQKIGGFPKFKNKRSAESFSNTQLTRVCFDTNRVFIPKFKGGIKCKFHRSFKGQIKTSTVSRCPSGKYFISILIDDGVFKPTLINSEKNKTLGIDLGITHFATFSNGQKVSNPRHLDKKAKRLKRAQRQMSRKKKGSANQNKARIKVARLHERVKNCRQDFLHKLTHKLVENQDYDSFAIEDLSVKSLIENNTKDMSRNISDAGWRTFREYLEYKAKRAGKNVLVIGRFDPSSRLCNCGYHNHALKRSDRTWTCPSCGETHDRDILAARNIVKFAFLRQETAKDSPESSVESSELSTCKLSDTINSISNLGLERPDCLPQDSLKALPKKRNKKSNMPVEGRKTRSKQEISQIVVR